MASANFRKTYFGSLGLQVVQAKPSLETALQGDILDIERLNKLCLWVRIPHAYRPLVWKVLLGTISLAKEVWPFVDAQREEQFQDLKQCVAVLSRPSSATRPDDNLTASTMVYMLLIQLDTRSPHHLSQAFTPTSLPSLSHLHALANMMLEVCDTSESDAYWLFESFVLKYNVSLPGHGPAIDAERERIMTEMGALQNLLKAQNAPLLNHILSFGNCLDVYCYSWFRTYFANVLPPQSLEGIWDIFIGGAPGIFPYLGLSLLLACKRKIEAVRSATELVYLFTNVERVVDMDAVANTAIDLWERPVLEGMNKDLRKALGYNF
ncbi:hypothetical protein DFJ77DRAFT_459852 [Powellomyces hirtus]|nr:hypothetical protein DFJ77DRAFT_459852 [Powellomyces hirtus]